MGWLDEARMPGEVDYGHGTFISEFAEDPRELLLAWPQGVP